MSVPPPAGPTQPPTFSALPAGAALAVRPFSVAAAIGFGWRRTWRNFWRLLLVSLVFLGVSLGLQLVTGLAGGIAGGASALSIEALQGGTWADAVSAGAGPANAAVSIIGGILSVLVAVFLQLGLIRVALGVTEGAPLSVGRVFHFTGFGSYLIGSIAVGVIVTVGVLIGLGPGLALAFTTDQPVWAALGGIVGVIIAVVLSVGFTFYGYAIVDRGAGGFSSLGASWSIVRTRLAAVFGLVVLLVLISVGVLIAAIIAGLLMLVVGLLITLPVAGVIVFGLSPIAIAHAYRTLSGEPVAS